MRGAHFIAALVPFVALVARMAHAQAEGAEPVGPRRSEPSTEARQHEERGAFLHENAAYEEAIAEYRKAYELKADPAYLFHMAESYRQLGHVERALFFYRRYVSSQPPPPRRDEAEARITELQASSPQPATAPPPGLTPAPPPPPAAAVEATAAPVPASDDRPYRRAWIWVSVGAAVVLGATVGVWAVMRNRDNGIPRSDLGNARLF